MKIEQLRQILAQNCFTIKIEEPLGNGYGIKVKLETDQQIIVYNTGKCVVQGKDTGSVQELISAAEGRLIATNARSNKVFVVYGHDESSRDQLEILLRRWGLEPIILDQMPSEGMTIIEKLEKLVGEVHFAVILATPDDEGHRRDRADEKAYRVRQNVVLELGMLLAKLGRKKVAILLKQDVTMEKPSDIQGLIYMPFKDSVEDAKILLAKELNQQGFNIPIDKL